MLCFEYAAHWRKILTAGEIWVYNLVDTAGEVLPYHCKDGGLTLCSLSTQWRGMGQECSGGALQRPPPLAPPLVSLWVIRGEAICRVQERETALLADAIMDFDKIIGQPAGR